MELARYQFSLAVESGNSCPNNWMKPRAPVAKFDKYLLSQLIVLFGFFTLVLVMIYWINRAVILFDQLIANGHSALVFLEFSALTMPSVIHLVLPFSAFAASLYCANRLAADSELVVVQSTGYSPFRLARPVLFFGVIVGLMFAVLAHFLTPASAVRLKDRQTELAQNASARLLQEGKFFHPAKGITFFIGRIDVEGTLNDIFLDDQRASDYKSTFAAKTAHLVNDADRTLMVMTDGISQTLTIPGQNLTSTRFDELVFDLNSLLAQTVQRTVSAHEMSTPALFQFQSETPSAAPQEVANMLREAHGRFAQSIFCVISALVGFSAILMGGFSRFSLWKQIVAAIVVLIIIKVFDNVLVDKAGQDPALWPLVYVSSAIGAVFVLLMLWISSNLTLFTRRFTPVSG